MEIFGYQVSVLFKLTVIYSETAVYSFQDYLKDTEDSSFLRMGNLGFLREDELFVTSCLKELIIIRG